MVVTSQVEQTATRPAVGRRVLGTYSGTEAGPSLVCLGGIHGNEPAGVKALERVTETLNRDRPPFRGDFTALGGNLRALAEGRRYIDRDLNRMWSPSRIEKVRTRTCDEPAAAEDAEFAEILAALESTVAKRRGPAAVFDMHTTSAEGSPFVLVGDTLLNRRLASALDVPLILGLEERIEGTILNHVNDLGFAAIGFEAGQHDAEASIANHEAAVWILLATLGCVDERDVPRMSEFRRRLATASGGLPKVFELRYRHGVDEADEFRMIPGFLNFDAVDKGEIVAFDRNGDVRAREGGRIFMPLYQKQGNDGFFIVRSINRFWLSVSTALRKIRADRVLPYLPGVDSLPDQAETYVADLRTARWFTTEIFHLLGYRVETQAEGKTVFQRRRQVDDGE